MSADLIAEVANGSKDALGELYDLYARPAYGVALHIVRNETLAEDAVADAFLTISRVAGTYRPEVSSPAAWILMLVHRRAVDIVRRELRRQRGPLDGLPRAEESAEESAIARSERQRVRSALTRLLPEQRQVLELAYYGGLTQAELAERLQVPVGTVKSRTFAGLTRLRTLLGGPEPVPLRAGGAHDYAGGDW